jgi:hypothetical protein
MDRNIKLVAFYLPQYHTIPENDEWWGKGFTEWVNVKKAKPLFDGHYQPRVPLHNNYYDLSYIANIEWQVDIARSHGIHGFCHYHYWFDDKQLLEKPTNLFLQSQIRDFGFCLAWANETWSKRWDGLDHHILQLQTHEPSKELWGRHFDYLIKAWTDERAIRIGGKPLFIIYRPYKIRQIENMFDYWQSRARTYGLDGIYFVAMKQFEFHNPECLKYFDGVIQFQPFEAMYSINERNYMRIIRRCLPRKAKIIMEELLYHYNAKYGLPTFYDYDKVWNKIIINTRNADNITYPGAFIDWDNTARYGRRATIFSGANPERFEYWMKQLFSAIVDKPDREPVVFINAWNEWAEGTYLEPDEKFGCDYLEAIRNSLTYHNVENVHTQIAEYSVS